MSAEALGRHILEREGDGARGPVMFLSPWRSAVLHYWRVATMPTLALAEGTLSISPPIHSFNYVQRSEMAAALELGILA
jgi:hypothetical protein